jgi:hypothetical protein
MYFILSSRSRSDLGSDAEILLLGFFAGAGCSFFLPLSTVFKDGADGGFEY